ncbi:MAG: GNAT family N-acetyltransferase [Gemmatimonadaceae bacterium]
MHNLARRSVPQRTPASSHRPGLSVTHAVRAAAGSDVADIHALLSSYSGGELLPRSLDDVALHIDDFVVVVDHHGRVVACASLQEYSPSVGEVAAVAVSPTSQGHGLGTLAVRGVEAVARRRGIDELFAVSRAAGFFESLGYRRAALTRYPEKLARYAELRRRGVATARKPCFRKSA